MTNVISHRCAQWVVERRGMLFPAGLVRFDDDARWWWYGIFLGGFDGTECPYCGVVLDTLLQEVAS